MINVVSRLARGLFRDAPAERARLPVDVDAVCNTPTAKIWRRGEGTVVPHARPIGWMASNPQPWSRVEGQWPNHVWRYDTVAVQAPHGDRFESLFVVDEFTGEYLAIRVEPKLEAAIVMETLRELFAGRGAPSRLRRISASDDTAVAVRRWLRESGHMTRHCEASSAGINGYLRQRLAQVVRERATVVTHEAAQALAETWRTALNAEPLQVSAAPQEPVARPSRRDVA